MHPLKGKSSGIASPHEILRWVYLGRVAVAIVVFVAAAFNVRTVPPETITALAVAAITAVLVSAGSLWHTHVRAAQPGLTFLYVQALFDLALVTTVVYLTPDGSDSQFPALYILVIAISAILMPLASSLLITSLASLLYLAQYVFGQHETPLDVAVGLQIGVFVAVFMATGWIASRVRVVGAERAELQQEVRRLRLEASDILRNIQTGVITTDEHGLLAFANPAATRLLGLPEDLEVGKPLHRLIGDRAPELVQAIETARQNQLKVYRAEGTVRTSGASFPIGVTTTSVDMMDGAPPSVTAIFTDISDQKRVEALHLRTERLQAVAELSASLAHEIRNPLASIRSSIEQLARSTRTNADERFLAELVVRESDRLSRLLSEFLDFSRVQVATSRPVDLGQVAVAAVDVVRQHPDCPVNAEVEVLRSPAFVEGDEDLLHRVVVNLVLNAVQAAGRSSRVSVEVRQAALRELPHGVKIGPAVLLKVSDNGPGIPEALQDKLFDPFVTGREGGSGLGLAIVQRAVEAHRGVVLVESTPGSGTTFRVLLPVGSREEVAA